ncbi:MAG: hypothetical protein LC800_15080, partial [Acidobacteria bacterium]|nr:hypothetical protein [Acidobacteriota bacterium]
LGLMFAGSNAAAVDWAGAHLLGYDPARITIAREAFGEFRWPLTRFAPRDITVGGDLGDGPADELLPSARRPASIIYPRGWRDAVAATTPDARAAAGNFGDETAPPPPSVAPANLP